LRTYFYTLKHTNKRAGANKPITLNPFPKVLRPSTLNILENKCKESFMPAAIKIDKLNEQFSMRIPEVTKSLLEKLTPEQKKSLYSAILILIAQHLHEATFDPSVYLSTGNSTDTL